MPCELHFLEGERAGSVMRFDQPTFWLGRDPRCELAFDPNLNLSVSGRHLRIVQQGVTYHLHDNSTNGTFVNGHQVKEVELRSGDTIQLGRGGPQLRFVILAAAAAPRVVETAAAAPRATDPIAAVPRVVEAVAAAPCADEPAAAAPRPAAEPTAAAPRGAGPVAAAPRVAEAIAPAPRAAEPALPAASAASRRQLRLVLEHLPTGPRREFTQQVIRIGRDPTADLPLDLHRDLLVSYNHAKIMILGGKPVLFDTESTNGTFVDGKRVSRQDLRGGEVIELGQGGPRLRLTLSSSQMAASPTAERAAAVDARPTLYGSSVELADLSLGQAALLGEYPLKERLSIGRDPSNTIVLDSMYVSHEHAVIERRDGAPFLRDAGSANGTYLAGKRITDAALVPGTEFVVGPYLLKFSGPSVLVFDTRTKTWVDAVELCRTDHKTARNFLDRISLKILPGEFLCILGPSGCGKSTLVKTLNGLRPADAGRVLLNNIDFYAHYEQLKHQVGYVPQDDIIHPQLSIWRTLHYAAHLRLPADTSSAKREERIRDVLSALELYDHRNKSISRLSGGQRKRVSIAVELLTDPAIIYLDEPTSGLDPNLEEKMMLLLREMTLRGKTVAAVTHTLDNVHLADKLTFLVDGKLAFFGDCEEAREFFHVERLPDIYKRCEERKGNEEALRAEFVASPYYERHIGSQLVQPSDEGASSEEKPLRGKRIGPGALRQFWVLASRYAEIMTRDLRNTAILLAQAPLIALFIVLAVHTDQPGRGPTSTMLLVMSLSALWFGCSNAAREITKEASIFKRERMVNLQVIPYVASKFFVLQWLALIQVTTMLVLVHLLRSGYVLSDPPAGCTRWGIQACSTLILPGVPGSFWLHLLNLYLTALNGIGLGLLISALAGNSDKAMSLIPLVLIPQVLFSGTFGVPAADAVLQRGAGYAMSLNWSLDQAKRIAMCTPEAERPPAQAGAGCTTCLHAYDPEKHRLLNAEAQGEDSFCAAVLPVLSQLAEYPESLRVMEDGLYTPRRAHGTGRSRDATKSYYGLGVLGGYALLFFVLVCLLVRLKDRKQR